MTRNNKIIITVTLTDPNYLLMDNKIYFLYKKIAVRKYHYKQVKTNIPLR